MLKLMEVCGLNFRYSPPLQHNTNSYNQISTLSLCFTTENTLLLTKPRHSANMSDVPNHTTLDALLDAASKDGSITLNEKALRALLKNAVDTCLNTIAETENKSFERHRPIDGVHCALCGVRKWRNPTYHRDEMTSPQIRWLDYQDQLFVAIPPHAGRAGAAKT